MKTKNDPVTTDVNGEAGRDAATGRFGPGNTFAVGNPHNRRCSQLRRSLLSGLTDDDFRRLGLALFDRALSGDVAAAKLILFYSLGRPQEGMDADFLGAANYEFVQAAKGR